MCAPSRSGFNHEMIFVRFGRAAISRRCHTDVTLLALALFSDEQSTRPRFFGFDRARELAYFANTGPAPRSRCNHLGIVDHDIGSTPFKPVRSPRKPHFRLKTYFARGCFSTFFIRLPPPLTCDGLLDRTGSRRRWSRGKERWGLCRYAAHHWSRGSPLGATKTTRLTPKWRPG